MSNTNHENFKYVSTSLTNWQKGNTIEESIKESYSNRFGESCTIMISKYKNVDGVGQLSFDPIASLKNSDEHFAIKLEIKDKTLSVLEEKALESAYENLNNIGFHDLANNVLNARMHVVNVSSMSMKDTKFLGTFEVMNDEISELVDCLYDIKGVESILD